MSSEERIKNILYDLKIINEKMDNELVEIEYLKSYLLHTTTPADDVISEENYHEKCLKMLQNLYDKRMKELNKLKEEKVQKYENNPLHLTRNSI